MSGYWGATSGTALVFQKEEVKDFFTRYLLETYRKGGVTPGHNPDGMSWTRERDKAEWFANRFGEGYILKGTAKKKMFSHFSVDAVKKKSLSKRKM